MGDPPRREIGVATARSRAVVPLHSGSSKPGFVPTGERDIDVAFLGPTSPERAGVAAGLRELERDGAVVQSAMAASLPWEDYMQVLARSRIAVSVRGLGYDTYRYWEIPYAGALLLSESPERLFPTTSSTAKKPCSRPSTSSSNGRESCWGGTRPRLPPPAGRSCWRSTRASSERRRCSSDCTPLI